MSITETTYGQLPDGRTAQLYTLSNVNGLSARITNYGGIVTELHVPDAENRFADVVLGKGSLDDYLAGHPCFGAIVGRVAGRIGNARFSIDGQRYELVQNNHTNCLHGGEEGFDKMLWKASIVQEAGLEKLQLELTDPDGHNNFPGTVQCVVTYALLDDNSLEISYRATTDKSTPLNLTNHSYFNLAGHDSGDVLQHEIQIIANSVATVDQHSTLIGRKDPVRPGYNDYRQPVQLAQLDSLETGNADIHFNHPEGRTDHAKLIATAHDPKSGRLMEVFTSEPGVQFYAGLCLSDHGPEKGKGGCTYGPMNGFCFEAQDYADSVNYPEMGGAVLKPGEVFESTTRYRFSTRG